MRSFSILAGLSVAMRQPPSVFTRVSVTRPLGMSASRIAMSDTGGDSAAAEARKVGEVKWFNTQKGFGFITPDDGSADVFVHQTAIYAPGFRSLAEGEKVEYEVRSLCAARRWRERAAHACLAPARVASGPRRLRRATTVASVRFPSLARTGIT